MRKSLPHDTYTQMADEYAARVDTKPHNAFYDRPAVLSLLPELNGLKILDAGCGTGVYAEELLRRKASVTALDANEKMLSHAKKRLEGRKEFEGRIEFHQANLEEPLSFLEDGQFDGIVSPLTITYVEDHYRLFKEFYRVLKPGGWFVFSTEHPFFSHGYFNIENYFETKHVFAKWTGFDQKITMPSYYHSLGAITDALTDNGFLIGKILEPKPTEEFRAADPERWRRLNCFPLFICIRAVKGI